MKDLLVEVSKKILPKDVQMMCPICGNNPAQDCGFFEWNYYEGDGDCVAPDEPEETCENCKHHACPDCKKELLRR